MTLNAILLSCLLATFTPCNGQNSSQIADSTVVIGDTVAGIDKSIWSIFQDKNNNFWFGSIGQGAYRSDGKTIIHFTTKDGLCHNRIWKIQEDKSGTIYFTTAEGISKFDGQTFSTLSVIQSNTSSKEWKLEPDDLWFQGPQDSGVVYRYDG